MKLTAHNLDTSIGRERGHDSASCAIAFTRLRRDRSFTLHAGILRSHHSRRSPHDRHGYAAIGQTVVQTGPVAAGNPFRFSTKYHDPCCWLVAYGERHYNLTLGRWACRDLVEETGGYNLYAICANDPNNFIDPFGTTGYEGKSGDTYRPDPFGHGVDPSTGKPRDPHVDRITPEGKKFRYGPDGTPRANAPRVPGRDLQAFGKALSKLGSVLNRFSELFIIIYPGYTPIDPDRPELIPFVPGQPTPPGYLINPSHKKNCPDGSEVPTEWIRTDKIVI